MPSIVEGDLPDFRSTYDILTGVLNDLNNPSTAQDPLDCINEHGQRQGEIAGRASIEAQLRDVAVTQADPIADYFSSIQTCAPDGFAVPDPIPLPSLNNPLLTGLEIALTPSTLNSGEDEALAAPDVFREGYDNGYTQGQIEGFDANIEQQFARPEPEPMLVSPIDLVIPPLTADPHNYSAPDYSPNNTSSSDSGSSGSSSSSGYPDP